MSAISDVTSQLDVRKVSILSQRSRNSEKLKEGLEAAPIDKFGLVKIIFLCYSLVTFLPLTFFTTANDYWMYKFRDPQYSTTTNHRTSLQAYFASSVSICRAIPSVIATLIFIRYGHKIPLRMRILWTLGVMTAAFVALTIFVEVPTDDWQQEFFSIVMALIIIVTGSSTILAVSQTVLVARFPPKYIKWHLYGQGLQGLFSAVLQIICLAIGNDSTQVAILYFGCGTGVILFTFILAVVSERLPFYTHYLGDTAKDTKRSVHTFEQIKGAASATWPALAVLTVMMVVMGAGHPNITSLVVSEYHGNGSLWNDKYFVPVITFLLTELVACLAMYLARPFATRENSKWIVGAYVIKSLIFAPAYMFCNAYSNSARHLPILFPHDWEYMVIIILDTFTKYFPVTCIVLSLPRFTGDKETSEIGFLLMNAVLGILGSLTSPLSTLWVKLL